MPSKQALIDTPSSQGIPLRCWHQYLVGYAANRMPPGRHWAIIADHLAAC